MAAYTPAASVEWLYTSDESPVQYGSLSQIRAYLRHTLKNKPVQYKAALKELAEFAKRGSLGTHTEVHRRRKRTGIFHYGIFPHKNEFFETDLMDVFGARGHEDANLQKLNDGYVFLLLVINVATKYVYAKKLRTKSSGEVAAALKDIFIRNVHILSRSRDFKSVLLHSDRGKEFYNDEVAGVLHFAGIRLYSSHSDHKSAVVERVIRTLRSRLVKAIEQKGEKWVDFYPRVIALYNKQFHRTIGMSPTEAQSNFELATFNTVQNRSGSAKPLQKDVLKRNKYKKGDIVRLKVAGHLFRKASAKTWTDEVYKIVALKKVKQHFVYSVEDMTGERILGKFDEHMLKSAVQEPKNINYKLHILKERTRNKKKEYFVHWDGYSKKDDQWISASEVHDI